MFEVGRVITFLGHYEVLCETLVHFLCTGMCKLVE